MSALNRKNAWMPKQTPKDRHKTKSLGVRLDEAVIEQFRELAKKNRRTLTAELLLALERHLRDTATKGEE